jgi:heme exporter protein C
VGVVFGTIGVTLGSIWARPTWGVWWDWDPRLTSAAVLLLAYAAYLSLRRFVEDVDRRATWSAVVAIVNAADIPVVYYSVVWWRSLHQVQSSPKTVDPAMVFALRWNAFAFLAVMIVFMRARYLIARARRAAETAPPLALGLVSS